MKIATWNVNSIRSRKDRVVAWLARERPDALCLQELKATEDQVPMDEIRDLGYDAVILGQKTYNGVAILSPHSLEDPTWGLGTGDADPQARLVSARIQGVRVLSAYFPNGRTVGSEAYAYKLTWMEQLRRFLESRFEPGTPVALLGDFNVAVDALDAEHPERWAGSVLCHADARGRLEDIRAWGFEDVVRKHNPNGHLYTWWDYRRLAFPKNDGLRIDHIFATAPLALGSTSAWVDRDQRKGGRADPPSDHAPVVATFDGVS